MDPRTQYTIVRPTGWNPPKGYENGILVPPGRALLFIAGQVAWDAQQRLVAAGDFPAQFRQALANVLQVVQTAGGSPTDLVSLTVFVVDKQHYLACVRDLGRIWRELVGPSWPAMALVEVRGLLESGALVEIQGIAAIAQAGALA